MYTKGKWEIQSEMDGVYSGSPTWIMCGKDFIAQTTIQRRSYLTVGTEEAIANAQLISSAPELLEACKIAVIYIDGIDKILEMVKGNEIGDKLTQAIQKAEGKV